MNIYENYRTELESKKTIASKKAFLTRSKKQVESYLKDMLEIWEKYNRDKNRAYYLGEQVTPFRIVNVKTELKVISNLQKQLEAEKGLKASSSNQSKNMAQPTLKKLKDQLLFETKQSNAFRLKRNATKTQKEKRAWQTLIDLADNSKNQLRKKITSLEKPAGLKAPAKGLVTLCSKTVGVIGRRKKDGTQKKGYVAKKGGKLVKKTTTKARKTKL